MTKYSFVSTEVYHVYFSILSIKNQNVILRFPRGYQNTEQHVVGKAMNSTGDLFFNIFYIDWTCREVWERRQSNAGAAARGLICKVKKKNERMDMCPDTTVTQYWGRPQTRPQTAAWKASTDAGIHKRAIKTITSQMWCNTGNAPRTSSHAFYGFLNSVSSQTSLGRPSS